MYIIKCAAIITMIVSLNFPGTCVKGKKDTVIDYAYSNVPDLIITHNPKNTSKDSFPTQTTIVDHTEYPPIPCCDQMEEHTNSGINLTWPITDVGYYAIPLEICLLRDNTSVKRKCSSENHWEDFTDDCYRRGTSTTNALNEILNSESMTIADKNAKLLTILENATTIIPQDITLTAKIIEKIADFFYYDLDATILTKTMDFILNVNRDVLKLSESNTNATNSILASYEKAMKQLALKINDSILINGSNITTVVSKLETQEDQVVAFYLENGRITVDYFNSIEELSYNSLQFAQTIPKQFIKHIKEKTENDYFKLVTTMYAKDSLFQDDANRQLGSWISNIFLPEFKLNGKLEYNFKTIFKTYNRKNANSLLCSYWKFDFNSSRWCIETNATNIRDGYHLCEFNHMTHFAILLGIENDENFPILSVIALIGCCLSITGTLGIILFAIIFEKWRRSEGSPIIINLSVINLTQMIFLLLLDLFDSKAGGLCVLIGSVLHYTLISQFCWMIIIGYLQYKRFVIVYKTHISYLYLKVYVFAYFLPTVPVSLSLALAYDDYLAGDYCYPTGNVLFYAVMVPVGLAISTNAVLYFLTCNSLCNTKFKVGDIRLLVRLMFFLFLILGLTWIFGLLANLFQSIVLASLFTVTATGQSFFLFLFFIMLNKTYRKMLWRKVQNNFILKAFVGNSTESTN